MEERYGPSVWVFTGGGLFPGGVFTTRELAEKWIAENSLNGCLTRFPLDEGFYDWAIRVGVFEPKKEHEFSPEFKAKFSCASSEHYHYENGERQS